MKIEMTKTYKTKSGLPVRILCVDRLNTLYPVVALVSDTVIEFRSDGVSDRWVEKLDLVEVSPYDDFKIDEPVMVRGANDMDWRRMYFAGIDKDGYAAVWDCGATSWTARGGRHSCFECRRPTEEELK